MFYHFRSLALHKATVESNTTLYSGNNIFWCLFKYEKKKRNPLLSPSYRTMFKLQCKIFIIVGKIFEE